MNDSILKSLSPSRATEQIRKKRNSENFGIFWTAHAKEQMLERGLISGDVLYLLKTGFVYEEGKPATQPEFFKYKMDAITPNSNGRTVRAIVIPANNSGLKIVSVMWVDESRQGS
jgi:hypothetical protein